MEKDSLIELLKGPGLRFAVVGGSLTILDLLLYQLLANVVRISLFGAPSSVAAVWVGTPVVIVLNFFISHRFVWHSSTSKAATIIPFFGLNIFSGIIVQSIVIAALLSVVRVLGVYDLAPEICNFLAKCVAVGVGMIINFFGAKRLFRWQSDSV